MHLGAWSEVLLGVREEVVRASADKVRTADFRVCDRELRIASLCSSTNKLVRYITKCRLAQDREIQDKRSLIEELDCYDRAYLPSAAPAAFSVLRP